MGLHVIECPSCKKPFHWFSGNPDQRCGVCKMTDDTKKPENVSTFSGSMNSNDSGEVVSNKVENKPAPREWKITWLGNGTWMVRSFSEDTTFEKALENINVRRDYECVEKSAYLTKCEELDIIRDELRKLQWQYDEREVAMRETGDMVRSLYKQQLEAAQKELESTETMLQYAEKAFKAKKKELAELKDTPGGKRLYSLMNALNAELDKVAELERRLLDHEKGMRVCGCGASGQDVWKAIDCYTCKKCNCQWSSQEQILSSEIFELKSQNADLTKTIKLQGDKVAELETELQEQARLNGMGSEREAKLESQNAEQAREIERLKQFVCIKG